MDPMKRVLLHHELSQLLYAEAEALDNHQMRDWIDCFTSDVTYEMPVRTVHNRDQGITLSDQMYHFLEDRESLEIRIQRLETKHAWAEDPPSRFRRVVGNIRVVSASDDQATVRSNVIITRNRGFTGNLEIVSAERLDTMRLTDGKWKIAKRIVTVDQATLGLQNLAFFI